MSRSNITLPKLPKPFDIYTSHHTESKGLVGSVTTWFPPSSTIQVGNNELNSESEPIRIPRPQFVEYIGNKKFVIVPRHNVLSVQPNSMFNRPEENVRTPDVAINSSADLLPNVPQTPDSAAMERNVDDVEKDQLSVEINVASELVDNNALVDIPNSPQDESHALGEDSEKTTHSPE